ncbi:hypothetical protein [Leisingera sp. M523]|uniref:hypothetical protein n=1 Tax=Leisingera sp. M523 TaxID=2867013 RepID=UPI0021A847B1|nr:hypothetical protein [Leisingera sp. M523]UWQ29933.1 hypothetical protein K3557_05125 [Leisingera sp. M523]
MEITVTMLWVGGAIVLYNLVAAGLSRAVQPLRLHVVDCVEKLISDTSIPVEIRKDLDYLADSLFSSYRGWLIVVTLPVSAIAYKFRSKEAQSPVAIRNHPRRKEIASTYALGIVCMIAKSPLCLVLFGLEMLLLVVLPVRFGRATRQAVHTSVGIDQHIPQIRWAN